MGFRFAAIFLFVLGVFLGIAILLSTGANTLFKEILAVAVPSLAGLILAIAWWRKSARPW